MRLKLYLIVLLTLVSPLRAAVSFVEGQSVLVKTVAGKTYQAAILKIRPGEALVRYEGYEADRDEWVKTGYLQANGAPRQSSETTLRILKASGGEKRSARNFTGAKTEFLYALEIAKKLYSLEPEDLNALRELADLSNSLGSCRYQVGEFREAAQDYLFAGQKFATIHTRSKDPLFRAAAAECFSSGSWAASLAGEGPLAVTLAGQGRRLDPSANWIRVNEGMAFFVNGDTEKARAILVPNLDRTLETTGEPTRITLQNSLKKLQSTDQNHLDYAFLETLLAESPATKSSLDSLDNL